VRAVQRFDVHYLRFWKDHGAAFFCQVQISEIESTFRAEPTPHHAAATTGTRGPRRALSPEKGIGKSSVSRLALGWLENAHARAVEGMSAAGGICGFLQEMIGGSEDLVLRDSQHVASRLKMARHLRLPICQTRPRPCVPNLLRRGKECAGVGDRSGADGTTVEDRGMAEQAHVEEPAQAKFRAPEPAMNGPTGERESLGRPATPHLNQGNPIAFFR
jgi:hypothetical protein